VSVAQYYIAAAHELGTDVLHAGGKNCFLGQKA